MLSWILNLGFAGSGVILVQAVPPGNIVIPQVDDQTILWELDDQAILWEFDDQTVQVE